MKRKKVWPWPVQFALYRDATAPRIFIRKGRVTLSIEPGAECEIRHGVDGSPTILLQNGANLDLYMGSMNLERGINGITTHGITTPIRKES